MTKSRTRPRKRIQHEKIMQANFVEWAWLVHKVAFVHVPNELMYLLPEGKKFWYIKLGVRVGMLDLIMFEPRGDYHGFVIELKSHGEKPTEEQFFWLGYLKDRGYYTCWCDNQKVAEKEIAQYLALQ